MQDEMRVLFVWLIYSSLFWSLSTFAQDVVDRGAVQYNRQGIPMKAAKKDSLQARDINADSITIFYRHIDSLGTHTLDSSITDITARFPMLFTHINMGTYGAADRSLLFTPKLQAGFDAGFHQFDVYKHTWNNARFYQTTRPYSEITYLLGSNAEQLIGLTHTQNRKPNFNVALNYRFSNMPGLYRTQNASHNNLNITAHYVSEKKRYESFFVFITNKHSVSENGGVRSASQIDSLALGDPYEVDTRLGSASAFTRNPFNTTVKTGNTYKETIGMYQHHYDFGQRDSIVKDTVTIHLFYPRLRLQHRIQWQSNSYLYKDVNADSTLYGKYFNYLLPKSADTVAFKDAWQQISNEFSVISYPEKKNQNQYVKAGIVLQNLQGSFGEDAAQSFTGYNVIALGEYRNRTRNNVWDVLAKAQLYLNGWNTADYDAYVSLQRQLSKRIGSLQIGLHNVNRTPSFVFDSRSNFPVKTTQPFIKENTVKLFATYQNPKKAFIVNGSYYLVSNYAYMDSFFTAKQEATLFNVLHLSAQKIFQLSKYWNWYTELHFQQTTGGAPVNLPHLLSINRLAFEGNFYTNLYLSAGIEARYYTRYKADGYSPFSGQFFYQNQYTVSNRPDINLFFNFRIKTFKTFIRLENINTFNITGGNTYNFTAQNYPMQGMWFRMGIWWTFIN